MTATQVALVIESSGNPDALSPRKVAPQWSSGSALLSALLNSTPGVTVTTRWETVFLTRSQQRIMSLALRDSLKIIE